MTKKGEPVWLWFGVADYDGGPWVSCASREKEGAVLYVPASEVASLRAEAAKWKAAHDEMVSRNRLLRDRPDLEALRKHIYDEWTAKADAMQREIDKWQKHTQVWSSEAERLRAALRASGPCGAVHASYGECGSKEPCNGDRHVSPPDPSGDRWGWPASEADPVASAERERQIEKELGL